MGLGRLVTCALWGLLLALQSEAKTFYSPYRSGGVNYAQFDMYAEGIRVDSVSSMTFQTKGKNDAHVLLQRDRSNYHSNVIEVVIGGWGNTQSVLRNSQQGTNRYTHRESGILDQNNYRWFWISWSGSTVSVGKGSTVGSSQIMTWNGLNFAVNGVRISYGYGSDGYWFFQEAVNGGWASWGSWGGCTANCGSGTKSRSRTCTNPSPAGGGSDCGGSGSDSTSCNTHSCPINGGWATWGSWGGCSLTCGTGSKSRTRGCTNPTPQHNGAQCAGSGSDSQSCNTNSCPIDGGWATWGSWGGCSLTCGTGSKSRTRGCTNPAPQHNGAQCPNSGSDSASCNTHSCPIDGGWATWGSWGGCSLTCGTGSKSRTRGCTNPAPQHNGAQCPNSGSDSASCNTHSCPIDGGWATWGSWGGCSLTCGTGSKSRTRGCTNPAPQHNGAQCPNSGSDSTSCNTHSCPIDGGWATWGSWGGCSLTCGTGSKSRTRGCTNPTPQHNGAQCPNSGSDSASCNTNSCPIDGGWTSWSAWATCSQTCATGTQGRTRSCTNPSPQHNGAQCSGVTSEDQNCNTHLCPINGGWASWGSWGSCTLTCGSGTSTRERSCTNPAPQHLGAACPNSGTDTLSCNTQPCPIDGAWTTWSAWDTCTVTCATGTQNRTRSCDNPPAQHGGADCVGVTSGQQNCNTHNCPIDGGWATWTSWSACGVTCSSNPVIQERERTCTNPSPQYLGADCPGSSNETQNCPLSPCPIDGAWGSWGSYGACSVTCLGGSRGRSRNCSDPAPAWGGASCPGSDSQNSVCNTNDCNTLPPVDGNWGSWQAWQGCSVTCGTGVQRRYRNCDNPAPASGGLACWGDLYEENACTPGGSCPVVTDGNWGAWSASSTCSATCGQGHSMKVRYCDNPAPGNGGRQCAGDAMVVETCTIISTCSNTGGGGTGSGGNSYGSAYVNHCPNGYFTCKSGQITCIQEIFLCECTHDCSDGSDEDITWAGCSTDIQCSSADGLYSSVVLTVAGICVTLQVLLRIT